jgi:hypothetical protein
MRGLPAALRGVSDRRSVRRARGAGVVWIGEGKGEAGALAPRA